MRTDPRKACSNGREKFFWAFVHDLFAHGAMALSCWSAWSLKFHDWTSHRAWPRAVEQAAIVHFVRVQSIQETLWVQELSPGIWRAWHPNVDHAITTTATDKDDMAKKAASWFHELSTEFGGRFEL